MALDTVTREIDGMEVRTTKLPARRALALGTRVAKIMVSMSDAERGQAAAIAAALTHIEGDEAVKMAADLLAFTSVIKDGRLVDLNSEAMIDHVFTGHLPTMLKVIMFSMEVNFGNFLDASAKGDGAAVAKVNP